MKQGNLFLKINYWYIWKKIFLHISQFNRQLDIEVSLSLQIQHFFDCLDMIFIFLFNSLRIQSLLNMKLYKLKKNDTLKLKRVIEDYNKVHGNWVSVNDKNCTF